MQIHPKVVSRKKRNRSPFLGRDCLEFANLEIQFLCCRNKTRERVVSVHAKEKRDLNLKSWPHNQRTSGDEFIKIDFRMNPIQS